MEPITRTECPEDKRLNFLPRHIGEDSGQFLHYEHLTFSFLEKASPDYGGGFWSFYNLSNGGFYMAPALERPLRIIWEDNYFDSEMSPDAAGICVSLMAQNAFAWEIDIDRFGEKFHALRDYAAQHEEAHLIYSFID